MFESLLGFAGVLLLIGVALCLMWSSSRWRNRTEASDGNSVANALSSDTHSHHGPSSHGSFDSGGGGSGAGGGSGGDG